MRSFGLFVGEFVNWMNKRLPEEKKVFSKDFFTEYKKEFKPNYILMIITSIVYIAILYRYGIHTSFLENLDLIKYIILTPMLLSVVVIDYKLQIIPNRLNLTMFELGLTQGSMNIAVSIKIGHAKMNNFIFFITLPDFFHDFVKPTCIIRLYDV